MTDLHRLPAEREPEFWDGQRALNRAPLFCPDGVESEEVIERRWPFLWSVIAAMLASAALWVGILWMGGWI